MLYFFCTSFFRSTTLEDIYRHYDNRESRTDDFGEDDSDKDDDLNEDFDGHITGYAYQNPGSSPAKLGHSSEGGGYFPAGGNGGGGYPYSHGGGNVNYPYPASQSSYGGGYGASNHGGICLFIQVFLIKSSFYPVVLFITPFRSFRIRCRITRT